MFAGRLLTEGMSEDEIVALRRAGATRGSASLGNSLPTLFKKVVKSGQRSLNKLICLTQLPNPIHHTSACFSDSLRYTGTSCNGLSRVYRLRQGVTPNSQTGLASHRARDGCGQTLPDIRRVIARQNYQQNTATAAAARAAPEPTESEQAADSNPQQSQPDLQQEPAAAGHDEADSMLPNDSRWRVFVAGKKCNKGGGLAVGDMQELLDVMHRDDFEVKQVGCCG